VASHPRAARRGQMVTAPDHRPRHHRDRLEWTPERFRQWAAKFGPHTEQLITTVLQRMKHPEQAYRTCMGILKVGQSHGAETLEAAAAQAVARELYTARAVTALAKQRVEAPAEPATVPAHPNVRGPEYYH